ncbi:MAG: GxxExxY protein [Bacteroidota bacterium]
MNENELSYKIIGAALEVHSELGAGLLESVYEEALAYELRELGFEVKQQLPIAVTYKGIELGIGFRIDLMINDKVILEMKSIECLAPVHHAQALTYLRLADKKLALLINFNEKSLKTGIHRIVNNL